MCAPWRACWRSGCSLTAADSGYPEGENHRTLFTQLDLDIAGGEFVALVGRSGSGKSTLLNLVSGIDLPDVGQIQVGDCVINALNETERTRFRRRQVGFVFQFFNLIPTLGFGDQWNRKPV